MDRKIVVIGASLGGLHALETLLGGLGEQFPVPIAIVQHRGKSSHDRLVDLLQQYTRLTVKEAEDKESLCPSTVYLAPADYDLLIERGSCALSIEAQVNYARPSVDILFDSAADAYGQASSPSFSLAPSRWRSRRGSHQRVRGDSRRSGSK